MSQRPPIKASVIAPSTVKSVYPEPFASLMLGRSKSKLGDHFGLSNFGVNLTELLPGAMSALQHHHKKQDEFIYILSGTPTLIIEDDEYLMQAGECCGFAKNGGIGHQLINKSANPVIYLEMGDRTTGDEVTHPKDDLCAKSLDNGSWAFFHKKDGSAY